MFYILDMEIILDSLFLIWILKDSKEFKLYLITFCPIRGSIYLGDTTKLLLSQLIVWPTTEIESFDLIIGLSTLRVKTFQLLAFVYFIGEKTSNWSKQLIKTRFGHLRSNSSKPDFVISIVICIIIYHWLTSTFTLTNWHLSFWYHPIRNILLIFSNNPLVTSI